MGKGTESGTDIGESSEENPGTDKDSHELHRSYDGRQTGRIKRSPGVEKVPGTQLRVCNERIILKFNRKIYIRNKSGWELALEFRYRVFLTSPLIESNEK